MNKQVKKQLAVKIMTDIENQTTVSRYILKDDKAFMGFFADMLNDSNYSEFVITDKLLNYVNNNY
jgi:hypothetical protein